jgi:hypothetical protein
MVIGLCGKAGSGKSTAIEALKTRGRPVSVNKFAGPLYAIQNYIYKVIEPVYNPPEDFVKDRFLLQFLGTDWGRKTINDSIWINLWKNKVEKVLAQDSNVIVVSDDTRFDNEAEIIRNMGGVIVHIIRDDASAHAVGGTGIAGHASEAGISPGLINYTIHNTGNLQEFQAALGRLYDRIREDEGLDKF